tara:strand:+ start:533 stop:1018 length:486 start_codon:yes stop_codon:yes gene_type:complete
MPFIERNFVKNFLTWKKLDNIIKDCDEKDFEVILENKSKRFGKKNFRNKSIIISNCLKYLDCKIIKEYIDNNKLFDYVNWDAHIYASFKKEACSFGKHFDLAHNLIVQQKGKSKWIVENLGESILHPGDMLYIPYKLQHECIPLSKRLSISFPFWPGENNG